VAPLFRVLLDTPVERRARVARDHPERWVHDLMLDWTKSARAAAPSDLYLRHSF
jgi:hypothetical protein